MVAMPFTSIEEIFSGQYDDKQVAIRGWVYRKRETKNTIFLVIRDRSGIIQCTVKRETPSWKAASKATIESSVALSGTVRRDKRALGGFEVAVDKLPGPPEAGPALSWSRPILSLRS